MVILPPAKRSLSSDESLTISPQTGNVDLPQAVKNCKTLIAVAGRPDIPIYSGADGPLLRGITKKALWAGHGVDGFGGFTVSEEWATFQVCWKPEFDGVGSKEQDNSCDISVATTPSGCNGNSYPT